MQLGMARSLADAYWLHEENVSSVLYPRSYSPSTDRRAFLEDFRLTAAAGLLKWFVCGMNAAEKILVSDMATGGRRAISIARLEFALERCRKFISDATHEDLDADEGEQRQQPSDEEWELFLDDFTAALHHGAGVECSSEDNSERLKVEKFSQSTAATSGFSTLLLRATCEKSDSQLRMELINLVHLPYYIWRNNNSFTVGLSREITVERLIIISICARFLLDRGYHRVSRAHVQH